MNATRRDLGARLREARLNVDLSQEVVAHELGISRVTLIEIEKGEREPTDEQLAVFAERYGVLESTIRGEEPRSNEPLVSLLRLTHDNADREMVETQVSRFRRICRNGAELEHLLGIPSRSGPPAYSFPKPHNKADAVMQGAAAAHQERQRLGLGDYPIPDVAELVTSQRIWASGADLPDEISGLFLEEAGLGLVVLVNFYQNRVRKRFSYAHEYAHALLDRDHHAGLSSTGNRSDLIEVRANSFAASFLMPRGGIRSFFRVRGKGLASKQETIVFDLFGDHQIRTTQRTQPGSQKVAYQDVAILANNYGVSYESAVYRLRSENLINGPEMAQLLEQKDDALELMRLLGFRNTDDSPKDLELRNQIIELSIEAFRRGLIDQTRLLEIGADIELSGETLIHLASAAAAQ